MPADTLNPIADAPEQVEIIARGPSMEYLVLLNHGDSPATVSKLGQRRELLNGVAIDDSIRLAPFGVAIASAANRK